MRKRASGAWEIDIRDQRLRGDRLTLSARTTSKPEARKRESAIRRLLEAGMLDTIERLRSGDLHITEVDRAFTDQDLDRLRPEHTDPLTLKGIIDATLRTVEATLRANTLKQYTIIGDQLIEAFGADADPASITTDAVEAWLHRPRNGKPWAPKTQQQKAGLAGRFFNDAIRREAEHAAIHKVAPRLTRNPFTDATLPEAGATQFGFLLPEEWRVLAGKVEGLPSAAPLALGCLTGLRVGEVVHLRPDVDVDMDARRIRIQERGGEHHWKPKSRRGTRELRIGDELYRTLRTHMDSGFSGDRYLITTPGYDRPVHRGTIANWTREAFTRAGIEYGRAGDGLTFHSLRHTFASWMVQRDVQLMKVARLLGDTVEQVVKTYGHLMPSDLDAAIDIVDSVAREGK